MKFFQIIWLFCNYLVASSGDNCPLEPLTDTNSAVHSSLCSLIRTNKQLAYYGVFDEHVCRSSGTVCGINGVTYNSECEAMSGNIKVKT